MKFKKFITIGAFSVLSSLSTMSSQAGIPLTDAEIKAVQTTLENTKQSMEDSLESHLSTPFFNERPNIKMSLVFDTRDLNKEEVQKFISINKEAHKLSSSTMSDDTNTGFNLRKIIQDKIKDGLIEEVIFRPPGAEFYREGNECRINFFINTQGKALELTPNKEILDITKLNNDEQIAIAQKFLLLHEQAHCEFGNIQHPVMIPGKSSKLNKELSHLLRDQVVDNFGNNIGYMALLNENYADISATFALSREYGADNPNLKYVLNAIKIQRQDNYFYRDKDTHFSHMGINEAVKSENVQKMLTIKTNEEMNDFMLKMANKSVLTVMADNPTIEESVFDKENFSNGVLQNTLEIIIGEYSKTQVPNIALNTFNRTLWADDIKRGFSYEFAEDILKSQNFDKSDMQEYYKNSLNFAQNLFDYKMNYWQERRFNNAHKTIFEMQDYVQSLKKEIQDKINPEVNQYLSHQKTMDVSAARKQMIILRSAVYTEKSKQKNKI